MDRADHGPIQLADFLQQVYALFDCVVVQTSAKKSHGPDERNGDFAPRVCEMQKNQIKMSFSVCSKVVPLQGSLRF